MNQNKEILFSEQKEKPNDINVENIIVKVFRGTVLKTAEIKLLPKKVQEI